MVSQQARRRVLLTGAVCAALSAIPGTASAQKTWDRGAGTNFWTDPANWNTDGVPAGGQGVIFTDTGAGIVDLNGVSQPASGSLTSLTFNNTGTGYSLNNGGTIFTDAITNTSGSVTNTINARVQTDTVQVTTGRLNLLNGTNVINVASAIAAGATLDVMAPSSNSIGAVSLNGGTLIVRGGVTVSNNQLAERYFNTSLGTAGLNPIDGAGGALTLTPTGTGTLTGPLTYSTGTSSGSGSTAITGIQTKYGHPNHNNMTMAWTGEFTYAAGGQVTFGVRSDDGGTLFVDLNNDGDFLDANELVVNNNGDHGFQSREGVVTLNAGQSYRMAIGFYQGGCCDNNGIEVGYALGNVTGPVQDDDDGGGGFHASPSFEANLTHLDPANPIAGTSFSFSTFSPANLSGSGITVTAANSVIDVQSTVGTLGNITFNAGTNLTVQGQGGAVATLGNLSGGATATLNTSIPTTAGQLSGFGTFTKGGTSSLTLNTDSSAFNGNIVVSAGSLRAAADNALGSTTGNTAVQSGGQLLLALPGATSEPVTIAGTGVANDGALRAESNQNLNGLVTLSADAFIVSANGGQTLGLGGGVTNGGFQARFGGNGNITVDSAGIGGTGGLRKTEGGTLNINFASPYSGTTLMENGTLNINAALGTQIYNQMGGTTNLNGAGTLASVTQINVTGGTFNANNAVPAAATLAVTGGTYNATTNGAMAGTSTVSANGILRVTNNVGNAAAINVVNGGRLHFDGANTAVTTTSSNINVDSNGLVRAQTGIADLSTQNIVIVPQVVNVIPNRLESRLILNSTGTGLTGNGFPTQSLTPTTTKQLNQVLDFADDNAFTAYYGNGQPGGNNFTSVFLGTFRSSSTAGNTTFGLSRTDDTSVFWVDLDRDGIFERAGLNGDELITTRACCGTSQGSATLLPDTDYAIAVAVEDTGGGSGLGGLFQDPGAGALTLINPTDPGQAGRFSFNEITGGGRVQVDPLAELRARTVTGATTTTLGGTLTLSTSASPLASSLGAISATSRISKVDVGANHTATAGSLNVSARSTFTKAGGGTLNVTGSTGITLDNSSIVANAGTLDLGNLRVGAVNRVTQTGLQGLLYVNVQIDPRNSAANVATLLATTPTNTRLLTNATGPNGGFDFRNDDEVSTFFSNTQVSGGGGNANWTAAWVGEFTAQVSGDHTFGFEQNDDNSVILIDLNRNGIFEGGAEQVHERGCCLQNPPNNDFTSGVASLAAGTTYPIAIINEDTGGGGNVGVKFMEPAGGTVTALAIIAPGAAGQTTQFTVTTGGGILQVDSGATLSVKGTDAPVEAVLAGTLRYSAQGSPTNSTLNRLTVPVGTGTVETLANQTLTMGAGTTLDLQGDLIKTGAGTLAINVAATGSGNVAVNGGTLGGTGSITGSVSIGAAGAVAPGNSVGTLSTGSFFVSAAGGTVAIELDPTNSQGLGTTDNINVTGGVTLTGGNLGLTLLSSPSVGQQFQIITNDGTDPTFGFATANGSPIVANSFTVAGNTFSINYFGGTGNDVVLQVTAIPEPASAALLVLGAAGLLARRRRGLRPL